MRRIFLPLQIALVLTGCAGLPGSRAPRPAPVVEPEVVERTMPRAVHWLRNSAEHKAVFVQTFRLAQWALEARVSDLKVGTWAVAIDADETVLDNSIYAKELAAAGDEMTEQSWHDWVMRREATALPGAIAFLTRVQDLGGRVAVVTNRRERHCDATRDVLSAAAVPFDVVLCRGDSGEKEPRWEAVELGNAAPGLPPLRIVMWLGDNIEDFPELDQGLRFAPASAFDDFGTSYIVFPNPTYGSWEDNPRN